MKPKFPEFGAGVLIGLGKAISSDPDVFVIFLGGILRLTRLEGLGKTLISYTFLRRIEQMVAVFFQKIDAVIRLTSTINN